MCLEGSHDFEDDIDCSLFLDLLRMVEQVQKQILLYKESLGYMTSPYVGHEAASYANVTKSTVSKFLKNHMLVWNTKRIISDNVLNLNNSTISKVCILFTMNAISPKKKRNDQSYPSWSNAPKVNDASSQKSWEGPYVEGLIWKSVNFDQKG
ncbi:hypothetical protein Gotur_029127 [Gossypium turneri]